MERKTFNTEQQAVIEATGGHHLVLAPPGCGKTAVLAERIVWAREHGVAFDRMACLTFTNRASRGMRERIFERMPDAEGIDSLFVGNVHRFCSHFLYDNGVVAEHTAVIDTDTSISIIADYLADDEMRVMASGRSRQAYSQIINLSHLMYQCEHRHPSGLMVHRDALKPSCLRELCLAFGLDYTQQSAIELFRRADHYRDLPVLLSLEARQQMEALYAARQYVNYKQQNDLIDFEDLLLLTYDATETRPGTLDWLQIDEVQDLNPLQLAIVDRFTAADATVVYLGDPQQAIFSFMGAQTDTLTMLRQRCGDERFHTFFENYRSPQYLLDVFNAYGQRRLGIDPRLLPTTHNRQAPRPGDLMLMETETEADELREVARLVKTVYETRPDETVAVVVAFNSDADAVSRALGRLPHFKVSGVDFFGSAPMRLLLAHLAVAGMEHNFLAWSHLFRGLQVVASSSESRRFVRQMMQVAVTPVDLLDYDRSTYMAQFVEAYEHRDLVVFDTETTGLDTLTDDVVQLAAVRVRRGRVTDSLNLFIETERPLPAMLGDVANPLVAEYGRRPHLSHAEALERFARFAEGCVLVGHNASFDYNIVQAQMQRYAPHLDMHRLWPVCFDTLKMTRLLRPRQVSYKLKDLLVELHLEGSNTHMADDDIMATLSLATYCYERGRSVVGSGLDFIDRNRRVVERFRHLYKDLFDHTRGRLYADLGPTALADELVYAYDYMRDIGKVGQLDKLRYVTDYIRQDLVTEQSGQTLASQLSAHMQDLLTMKEADLCGASSMSERVFVSTVHKAKGLEFDHVVVYDAVDGKYPSAFASTDDGAQEEARKFYVAISRARHRLTISACRVSTNGWGRQFERRLTPYMDAISQFFADRATG